ncbi:MAG TPA: siphovirus Gp157 family protein [Caulobacteraceae bacterium]
MQPMLVRSLAEHEYLREHLLAEFQEIDEDTLRDTLEGISNLPEALAVVVRTYLDDLTLASALGLRIAEMQQRLARIEARADKMRCTVASVMERADIKKLAEPDFTASLRAVPPGLLIADESVIPEPYWRPQPPKLDKKKILATLSAGDEVAGARMGNGGSTLSVRTK